MRPAGPCWLCATAMVAIAALGSSAPETAAIEKFLPRSLGGVDGVRQLLPLGRKPQASLGVSSDGTRFKAEMKHFVSYTAARPVLKSRTGSSSAGGRAGGRPAVASRRPDAAPCGQHARAADGQDARGLCMRCCREEQSGRASFQRMATALASGHADPKRCRSRSRLCERAIRASSALRSARDDAGGLQAATGACGATVMGAAQSGG